MGRITIPHAPTRPPAPASSNPTRPPAPAPHPDPPAHSTNAPTGNATVPPSTRPPTLSSQNPPVSTVPPHSGPPAPSTHPTPNSTPNGPTPPRSMLSRLTSGVGSTITQAATYAALPVIGSALLSGLSHVPGPVGGAAHDFLDAAGDAGHWLATIPSDIRHGVEHAANTTRNVTYLLVAGTIIGGAIWAYRQ